MEKRGSGILLHLTSLPSPFGVGDLGPSSHGFAEILAEAGQTYWQILPLNPTEIVHGNSPYQSASAFASNPLFISPELLVQDDLLDPEDLSGVPPFPVERVLYETVVPYKRGLLEKAFQRFKGRRKTEEFERFQWENAYWLDDYSLFIALKSHFQGRVWSEWPEDLRDRKPDPLRLAREDLGDGIERNIFLQFIFCRQWQRLKGYCKEKGIQFFGDMPIYVIHDSADVWVHPYLFKLDPHKRPQAVAGVPPDYFSETGQLWGNPVYNWEALKATGYEWWIQRITHNLKHLDLLRIDHFRGFFAYWEVPATEKNAIKGQWVKAPAMDFFDHVTKAFPRLPVIAEDLGTITPDVWEVMDHFRFPGMKVLLFAFGKDLPRNPYAPHNHVKNCVVYTGTHDNNTIRGWFKSELTPEDRKRLSLYVGKDVTEENVHWELIRLGMSSVADTVIIPMQDILGLDGETRMNLPASQQRNWEWRLSPGLVTASRSQRLREMTEIYGRL